MGEQFLATIVLLPGLWTFSECMICWHCWFLCLVLRAIPVAVGSLLNVSFKRTPNSGENTTLHACPSTVSMFINNSIGCALTSLTTAYFHEQKINNNSNVSRIFLSKNRFCLYFLLNYRLSSSPGPSLGNLKHDLSPANVKYPQCPRAHNFTDIKWNCLTHPKKTLILEHLHLVMTFRTKFHCSQSETESSSFHQLSDTDQQTNHLVTTPTSLTTSSGWDIPTFPNALKVF